MKVIGIAGVATAGKDEFAKHLVDILTEKGYRVKKLALADPLKAMLTPYTMSLLNIDAVKATGEQKTLIRPLMVATGIVMRESSEGQYWTGLLEKRLEPERDNLDFAIVTDVRHAYFPKDEVWWIQEKMKGIVVHISRYNLKYGDYDTEQFQVKEFIPPANTTEEFHDWRVKQVANHIIEWPSAPDLTKLTEHCRPYVENFCRLISND